MFNKLTKNASVESDESLTILKGKEEVYLENRSKLISLLSDHPYLIEKINEWKVKVDASNLPEPQEKGAMFIWEKDNKDFVDELKNEVSKVISEFAFNVVYRLDIEDYFYNQLVCPSRSTNPSKVNVPSLVVFETGDDRKINAQIITPNARYIQVFDWTTLKDIEDNWSDIKKVGMNADLKIDTGDGLSKVLWQYNLAGIKMQNILKTINENYKSLLENLDDKLLSADIASTYIFRYKQKLKKLKDF